MTPMGKRTGALFAGLVALTSCAPGARRGDPTSRTLEGIRPEEVRAHMSFLADDLLEGRETASRGYLVAARYVAAELEGMGLAPAGDDGTYWQTVPLRKFTLDPGKCKLVLGGKELRFQEDFIAGPLDGTEHHVRAPLVFAGYGISAPELGYDDFADLDASGKILITLSGAPPAFGSTERAYYSSRENKASMAAAKRAVAVLTVQTPVDEARFGWSQIKRYALSPSMRWIDPKTRAPLSPGPSLEALGILSGESARALFATAPVPLEEIFAQAAAAAPPRFPLDGEGDLSVGSIIEDTESPNVVARLEGSDPVLKSEHVVFSAHLDHVGVGQPENGDAIYNGAYDNASGVAVMLTVARAFSRLETRPRRSLLFLVATGEEEGLLGSDYFARHPTVPGDSIVADVNADGVLMLHPLHDIVAFGADHSSLLDPVSKAASMLGVSLTPDFMPEEVIFVRSDQYSFVKQGVPSVYAFVGTDTGDARLDGRKMLTGWMASIYHHPSDDMKQEFDFGAGADYAKLDFLIGAFVADADARPRWNEGDFLGEKFGR
jgi:Zn-dependent M28 family amino/carboxypeptidase